MDLTILGNQELKTAVQENLVSFPSQAPAFRAQTRADIGWRIAVLYFVRGWSLRAIASRYHLSRERAGQIATQWLRMSVRHGYIQEIPGGPL